MWLPNTRPSQDIWREQSGPYQVVLSVCITVHESLPQVFYIMVLFFVHSVVEEFYGIRY